jgi:preprotein translocase subunit SecY
MCNRIINVLIVIVVLNSVVNVAKSNDKVKVQETTKVKQNETLATVLTEAGEVPVIMSPISTTHNSESILSRGKSRGKIEELSNPNSTISAISANSESFSSTTTTTVASTNVSLNSIVTMKPLEDESTTTSKKISTTTTTTIKPTKSTTTTKKPKPKKPTVTKSADEDQSILDSEKKIKFSPNHQLDPSTPEVEYDIDRNMENEKKARHSYTLFMAIAFGLPMTITIVHIFYKKVKSYLELRHYQRVVS